jgi:replicative DNA helicase
VRNVGYKKETSEKPGVAEIELAKHRHGPTGRVEMYWQSWLMRFAPLQVERPRRR